MRGKDEDIDDFLELQCATKHMVRSHLTVTPALKNRMSKMFAPPVCRRKDKILGVFAKLREVTRQVSSSVLMSACPHGKKTHSCWMDFY